MVIKLDQIHGPTLSFKADPTIRLKVYEDENAGLYYLNDRVIYLCSYIKKGKGDTEGMIKGKFKKKIGEETEAYWKQYVECIKIKENQMERWFRKRLETILAIM